MKRPTIRSVVVLALCASACGATRPRPESPAEPGLIQIAFCRPEDALALAGNLGRTSALGRIVVTHDGYRGHLRLLGSHDSFEISGQRGARIPNGDDPEAGVPVFECRFEIRSGGELFGTLTGRCTEPRDDPSAPSLGIEGTWSLAVSSQASPAFLAETAFQGVPDDVYAGLSREEGGEHECAAFVDVREARRLSRSRVAVLYERRFPCEPDAWTPGTSHYRLAIVDDVAPQHFEFSGPLRGIQVDPGYPSLVVYQIAPQRYVFDLRFTHESRSGAARPYVEHRSALFALTAAGRAGPLVELPLLTVESGCSDGPLDTTNPWFVDLDGSPPAELVLEHDHVAVPCTDGPVPPSEENDETSFVAYRLDPEQARFDRIPLGNAALAVQQRRGWNNDVSGPVEEWNRPAEEPCDGRFDRH